MMKKMATYSKSKGMKLDTRVTYVVNSGQGKVAGVCFLTKQSSMLQYALAVDVILVLDGS